MRLPRNISGEDLIKGLNRFGYHVTRQSGSHIRLTRVAKEKSNHITIPKHDPLRLGTLNNILRDVATHLKVDKTELIEKLFA